MNSLIFSSWLKADTQNLISVKTKFSVEKLFIRLEISFLPFSEEFMRNENIYFLLKILKKKKLFSNNWIFEYLSSYIFYIKVQYNTIQYNKIQYKKIQ